MIPKDPPEILYWKNPYHLFQKYSSQKTNKNQEEIGRDVIKEIKQRPKHLDEARWNQVLHRDYIDFAKDGWRYSHCDAINTIMERDLKTQMNVLDIEDRLKLEAETKYSYPDLARKVGDDLARYYALRGLWQMFHQSALHEHVQSGSNYIRAFLLLVYGFVPSSSDQNGKESISALIIGRSGIWKAKVWIEFRRLIVAAEDSSTREDQFFLFRTPALDDPTRRPDFDRMRGIMAGTVLDKNYGGDYPVVATPCVARKLSAWTTWFKAHDQLIDTRLVLNLRNKFKCDYYQREKLVRSYSMNPEIPMTDEEPSMGEEACEGLESLINQISDLETKELLPCLMLRE